MGNIFRLDSPVMKFLTLITNLICLNVLWLLCCLPVFTAGASTAAMYSVVFQYITKRDDAVIKPFFRAFKENFRTATPIWILNFLIGLALGAEVFYLSQGAPTWLILVFLVMAFVYLGATSYLYPLLARYDAPVRTVVLNSFTLSTKHLLSTFLVVALNALPFLLAALDMSAFLKSGILWVLGGFSLIAYLNGRVLLSVFQKYEPQDAPSPGEE